MEWTRLKAPSLADFEDMAGDAWGRLPAAFRTLCDGLVIRIEDFPDEEILQEMGLESPFDLLGLYQGVDLTQKSLGDPPTGPDMVFLYRRAILDLWSEGEESLGHLIRHVLIHEIGHHFGLSDDDMEAIEATGEEQDG